MSTKDRLLFENEGGINRQLFMLAEQRSRLESERAKYPDDQLIQLEFDRVQGFCDDQVSRLRRLKEQNSKL